MYQEFIFVLILFCCIGSLYSGKEENMYFSTSLTRDTVIKKLTSVCIEKNPHKVYYFEGIIGRGRRGTVYKCVSKKNGTIRAIKMYPFGKTKHFASAYNEVDLPKHRIGKRRGFLKYYEAYVYHGKFYIVMEYIDGITLDAIPKPYFTVPIIQNILGQMVQILKFLSSQYLCHFDIKRHNFMINKRGELILIDLNSMTTVEREYLPSYIQPTYYQKPNCNDWAQFSTVMGWLVGHLNGSDDAQKLKKVVWEIKSFPLGYIPITHPIFQHPVFANASNVPLDIDAVKSFINNKL